MDELVLEALPDVFSEKLSLDIPDGLPTKIKTIKPDHTRHCKELFPKEWRWWEEWDRQVTWYLLILEESLKRWDE